MASLLSNAVYGFLLLHVTCFNGIGVYSFFLVMYVNLILLYYLFICRQFVNLCFIWTWTTLIICLKLDETETKPTAIDLLILHNSGQSVTHILRLVHGRIEKIRRLRNDHDLSARKVCSDCDSPKKVLEENGLFEIPWDSSVSNVHIRPPWNQFTTRHAQWDPRTFTKKIEK